MKVSAAFNAPLALRREFEYSARCRRFQAGLVKSLGVILGSTLCFAEERSAPQLWNSLLPDLADTLPRFESKLNSPMFKLADSL
ncbi:hypothetical protein AMECASPLE_001710 [Ameca splendens]|uniref:Uncharacterized protein n=1 Tax=Ameca splendens TaxID=208324 RepID=A0ABV0YLD2_9TELE